MNIIKYFISRLLIVDSSYFYLKTIIATYKHIKLVQHNFNLYRFKFGRSVNWRNPTRYSEKIQLFMISRDAEKIIPYADKYQVRSFVQKMIGEEYLVPTIGIYTSVDEIDFEKLPKSFVLKCTHGSNWNIICKDKRGLDWPTERSKLENWLHSNFYSMYFGERQYRTMQPRVVCEEYLHAPDGLTDYKFHCFKGIPRYLRVMTDRQSGMKKATYDMNWNRTPFTYLTNRDGSSFPDVDIPKPKNFEKMVEMAQKLSAPFPYVRVDLYNISGKIYFGELTFSPNAGFDVFSPDSFDEVYGKMIEQ